MKPQALHAVLGWPTRAQALRPTGAGPRALTASAQQKIGENLQRIGGGAEVVVGLLFEDPASDASAVPVAIICEFTRPVSDSFLREAHRLAWNFAQAPLLVTVEPTAVRTWSNYAIPARSDADHTPEIADLRFAPGEAISALLHWPLLSIGAVQRSYPHRFDDTARADRSLLRNLTFVRTQLLEEGLSEDVAHDLLARLIFVQFLFQRKDSSGKPALTADLLGRLANDQTLSSPYSSLGELLTSHSDTYRLFRWLNGIFNGDLFPGRGETPSEREREWQLEMKEVKEVHLRILSDFVGGRSEMGTGQLNLWELYSFDAIPLDFISSIYEQFVHKEGADAGTHYTPAHLVDYVLDGVLPWRGRNWDLRILDPSCGSGIFLVKAFQRLMHRWRAANKGSSPPAEVLRRILVRNLVGVDTNNHAVRVASFSLYLAMCDAIDPRHYWKSVRFPRLRDQSLLNVDFFTEDQPAISTETAAEPYDLVVGNAPWGQQKEGVSEAADAWAKRYEWPLANKDFGTLFLAKGASLLRPSTGRLAILQSANAFLFNARGPAGRFRKKLFSTHQIEEVTNFSALRFSGLFAKSVAPTCAVVLAPQAPPADHVISYICPKSGGAPDRPGFVIRPTDLSEVANHDVLADVPVWTALMWGGRRDLELITRLARFETLDSLEGAGKVALRKGVVINDRQLTLTLDEQYYYHESPNLSGATFPFVDVRGLPRPSDLAIHSHDSPSLVQFRAPQVLLHKGWKTSSDRFTALAFEADSNATGIVCTQSLISAHFEATGREWLWPVVAMMNSKIAVYFLMLTSGRLAQYRPEPLVTEFRAVPLPSPSSVTSVGPDMQALDAAVMDGLALDNAEISLIEDLFHYTMPDFRGSLLDGQSPLDAHPRSGYLGMSHRDKPIIDLYVDVILDVIQAGFGNQPVGATVTECATLPVTVVALHFGNSERIRRTIAADPFLETLQGLHRSVLKPDEQSQGVRYERELRVYTAVEATRGTRTPTVIMVKPAEARYWLPSIAMEDADKICADLIAWGLINE